MVSFSRTNSAETLSKGTSSRLPCTISAEPFPFRLFHGPSICADIFSEPVRIRGFCINAVRIAGFASTARALIFISRLRRSTVPRSVIDPSRKKALSSCNLIFSTVRTPLLSRAFSAIWSYFTPLTSRLYPQKSATVSASGPLNSNVPATSPLTGKSTLAIFRMFWRSPYIIPILPRRSRFGLFRARSII